MAERLSRGKIATPYEKRFASLMHFLEDIMEVRDLQKYYHCSKLRPQASNQEEFCIDVKVAGGALVSNFWWAYSLMLECLGAALHELGMFGRSCPCHRISKLAWPGEPGNLHSYYQRRKRFERETLSKNQCCFERMCFACACVRPWQKDIIRLVGSI